MKDVLFNPPFEHLKQALIDGLYDLFSHPTAQALLASELSSEQREQVTKLIRPTVDAWRVMKGMPPLESFE